MKYLLDSDTLNYLLKGIPSVSDAFRAANHAGAVFALSPIVHFEVARYLRLKRAIRIEDAYRGLVTEWQAVHLDLTDYETAVDLWAKCHAVGRPVSDSDLLIAVSALKAGAILVTNNTSHFDHLGVPLANWAANSTT